MKSSVNRKTKKACR